MVKNTFRSFSSTNKKMSSRAGRLAARASLAPYQPKRKETLEQKAKRLKVPTKEEMALYLSSKAAQRAAREDALRDKRQDRLAAKEAKIARAAARADALRDKRQDRLIAKQARAARPRRTPEEKAALRKAKMAARTPEQLAAIKARAKKYASEKYSQVSTISETLTKTPRGHILPKILAPRVSKIEYFTKRASTA